MAEEYFIHEVIISDSEGNLFNYHSDYMNENFSYDKEHDQISEYRPTQVTEQLREERDKTIAVVHQLWECLRRGYTYSEAQIHMRAVSEGKTTVKKVVVEDRRDV